MAAPQDCHSPQVVEPVLSAGLELRVVWRTEHRHQLALCKHQLKSEQHRNVACVAELICTIPIETASPCSAGPGEVSHLCFITAAGLPIMYAINLPCCTGPWNSACELILHDLLIERLAIDLVWCDLGSGLWPCPACLHASSGHLDPHGT
jgi:hypothetical protein